MRYSLPDTMGVLKDGCGGSFSLTLTLSKTTRGLVCSDVQQVSEWVEMYGHLPVNSGDGTIV